MLGKQTSRALLKTRMGVWGRRKAEGVTMGKDIDTSDVLSCKLVQAMAADPTRYRPTRSLAGQS